MGKVTEAFRSDEGEPSYKVKWTLNLLPSMNQDQLHIADTLGSIDDLEVLETESVQCLLDYKWGTYARYFHYFGGFIHAIHVLTFCLYVD